MDQSKHKPHRRKFSMSLTFGNFKYLRNLQKYKSEKV